MDHDPVTRVIMSYLELQAHNRPVSVREALAVLKSQSLPLSDVALENRIATAATSHGFAVAFDRMERAA